MSKNSSKYNFSHDFWPAWTFKCNKRKFKKNCEKLRHHFAQQTIAISKVFYTKKSKNGYQDRELQVEMAFGRHVTIVTDHKPLLSILWEEKGIAQSAASRLKRWAIISSGYNYTLKYETEASNSNLQVKCF